MTDQPMNPLDRADDPGRPLDAESEGQLAEASPSAQDGLGGGMSARYSQAQLRRARDVLSRLYGARRAVRFYPLEHPAVTEAVGGLLTLVSVFHREGVDVRFAFFEGEILLGDQLLAEESVLFDQLVRDMTGVGVGWLNLRRGVDIDELTRTLEVLGADTDVLESAGGAVAAVRRLGLEHVDVGDVAVVEGARGVTGDLGAEARATYTGAVSLMREIDRLIRANRQASAAKVKGVVRSLVDNALSNQHAMLQLTGLKNYDEYTFFHSANVAILSLALGSKITSDYRFLTSLGVGALLHDIGKLAVDNEILNKPGALTPEEWASVREHPVQGAQVVSMLPGVDRAAVVTILEHHMRYDGSGYPARRLERRQHLASRIVAVADAYDAMTSQRSYSVARVQDEAMALLIKSAGTALDPVLVRLFVQLMGLYPPRSVVRLAEGQVAVVLRPSPSDPLRPLVRIIATPTGEFIEPYDIDLSASTHLAIRGCIDPRLLNVDVEHYLA